MVGYSEKSFWEKVVDFFTLPEVKPSPKKPKAVKEEKKFIAKKEKEKLIPHPPQIQPSSTLKRIEKKPKIEIPTPKIKTDLSDRFLELLGKNPNGLVLTKAAKIMNLSRWQMLTPVVKSLKEEGKISKKDKRYFLAGKEPDLEGKILHHEHAQTILSFLGDYPEGLNLVEIGQKLNLGWRKLRPAINQLLDDGKVVKEDKIYVLKENAKFISKKSDLDDLQNQIYEIVKSNPNGILLTDIAEKIPQEWYKLRSPATKLVKEGKVTKKGKLYYPIP